VLGGRGVVARGEVACFCCAFGSEGSPLSSPLYTTVPLLLSQVNGQLSAAVDWLRKKGVMAATKKAGRVAAEGLVGLAVASDGLSAAVVEVRVVCPALPARWSGV
jgi:hypothetical protein